jgi:DNA polymerase-3 subunit gamma/tau
MSYLAMARRFRPQRFSEVAAQTHITETLRRALESDRVASAYLFAGPRGSGKTTVARILAKAVNCDHAQSGEPCAECESCRGIADGRSLDTLEIDGASNNSVDDVRELRENVGYAASSPGKRKIYIIDEVHMLSTGAFNALLKTLEEPPSHVVFVFATTEPRKVPQTILSRCQRFDFRRLLIEEIRERLQGICKKEKVDIEPAALFVIAKRADGSMRDGMSLLDQVISSTSGSIRESQVADVLGLVREEIYIDLSEAILEHDAVRALQLLHAALREGSDPAGFALGLVEHLRNLLLLSVDASLRGTVQLGESHLQRAEALAARFRTEDLLYLLNRAAALHEEARNVSNPAVSLEAAMVEMARFESRVLLSEVLERLGGEAEGPAPSDRGGGRSGVAGRTRSTASTPSRGSSRTGGRKALEASERPSSATTSRPLAAGGPLTPPTLPEASAASAPVWTESSHSAAPSATQDVPAAALDVDSIRARWSDFTHVVGGSKAMLAQCLSEGIPTRLDGSILEVRFAKGDSFHMSLLEVPGTRAELETQLHTFFGRPPQVRLGEGRAQAEIVSESTSRLTEVDIADSRRAAVDDVVRRTPRLQDILDAFDGEILEDRDG